MNVVFLDYDGVVNTPLWDAEGKHCSFGFPEDNKVNNFQCTQWVSEFCQQFNYSIVVTSTWRFEANYKECLINGGLRDGIEILGKTGYFHSTREHEIQMYLEQHPEVEQFLIFDDDANMGSLSDHLVLCDPTIGFRENEYHKAERLHEHFTNRSRVIL